MLDSQISEINISYKCLHPLVSIRTKRLKYPSYYNFKIQIRNNRYLRNASNIPQISILLKPQIHITNTPEMAQISILLPIPKLTHMFRKLLVSSRVETSDLAHTRNSLSRIQTGKSISKRTSVECRKVSGEALALTEWNPEAKIRCQRGKDYAERDSKKKDDYAWGFLVKVGPR